MGIIAWIVLGLIAGAIAKTLLGGRAQHGLIVTALIGIAGALLGGWVAATYFNVDATAGFFDVSTWLTAIAGSVVLLLIYHALTSRGVRPGAGAMSSAPDDDQLTSRAATTPATTSSPTFPGSSATQDTKLMTNFEPDPVPVSPSNPNPGLVELTPAGRSPLAEAEDREQRRWNQTRTVRMVCTIITVICGLFAAVLAAHIVMVLGEANPTNGVATFVRGWAGGVSLGLDGLFTPDNTKTQVLLNSGLAALAWLALGAVATMLIRRFALPGPRRPLRHVMLSRRKATDPTSPR